MRNLVRIKIDGEIFYPVYTSPAKKEADRKAEQYRFSGYHTRVVKRSGEWAVYTGRLRKGVGEPRKRITR